MNKNFSYLIIMLFVMALILIGKKIYLCPKYSPGVEIEGFTTKLMDGSEFKLSQLRGKYVLLDFWGSWCGPCRNESKFLVQLNEKYGKGNFQIVSVGVEKNKESWERAINQDGLSWKFHILETNLFKSPLVLKYGVKEIPTKYLIDKNGLVIKTNPSFSELDDYLSANLTN
jgi:thiol-disulfide isomerase/thioredoxin